MWLQHPGSMEFSHAQDKKHVSLSPKFSFNLHFLPLASYTNYVVHHLLFFWQKQHAGTSQWKFNIH